ncbi:MAG TPA: BolA family protein [Candidatus Limnocylindrales bacterium]|nr:BolA family protein [Candidatus Limnocylindrales bacterium]
MHTVDVIREKLTAALAPTELVIEDDSGRHRGHKGSGGGGHYLVRVVSDRFAGLGPVARHRLVYQALSNEMGGSVHALALTTLTPEEAAPR